MARIWSTARTCSSAPLATWPTDAAISPMARPTSSVVATISTLEVFRVVEVPEMDRTTDATRSRISTKALRSASRSERGVISTAKLPDPSSLAASAVPRRYSIRSPKAWPMAAISSRPWTSTCWSTSPWARALAALSIWRTPPTIRRDWSSTMTIPSRTLAMPRRIEMRIAELLLAWAAWLSSLDMTDARLSAEAANASVALSMPLVARADA